MTRDCVCLARIKFFYRTSLHRCISSAIIFRWLEIKSGKRNIICCSFGTSYIIHVSSIDYEKRCARFSTRRRSTLTLSPSRLVLTATRCFTTRRVAQREFSVSVHSVLRKEKANSVCFFSLFCLVFFLPRRSTSLRARSTVISQGRHA